ncbi:GNAT family N-acetyltransferase [Pseudonocardia sp. TRM90224]|uniref:GNAT family N-acetyltransferase n=1 Tax=Pseudonocardia sp. TRM90224 TaxID=2812678 RepID=UPI001E3E0DF5|nr:GNAT family N-acetyltransferase [Pseudonocardia sp. TRM90224]
MPPIEIRPFRRSDRDQLTALVNAHIDAVLPGVSVSPNAVLGQLERSPDEPIVGPWIVARETLVALRDGVLAAAVHLVRYGDDNRVGADMRGTGELTWLLFRPQEGAVADALCAAGLATLRRLGVTSIHADGGLPAPATYGVPARWPHVAAALDRAGFRPGERIEAVLVADLADLPGATGRPDLALRFELGDNAPRFSAVHGDRVVGHYEVQSDLTAGGTLSRLDGWADTWSLYVEPDFRRRGVATWLVGHAADRLRFGGARRLLDYAVIAPESDVEPGLLPFLTAIGFRELTRTTRGWTLGR